MGLLHQADLDLIALVRAPTWRAWGHVCAQGPIQERWDRLRHDAAQGVTHRLGLGHQGQLPLAQALYSAAMGPSAHAAFWGTTVADHARTLDRLDQEALAWGLSPSRGGGRINGTTVLHQAVRRKDATFWAAWEGSGRSCDLRDQQGGSPATVLLYHPIAADEPFVLTVLQACRSWLTTPTDHAWAKSWIEKATVERRVALLEPLAVPELLAVWNDRTDPDARSLLDGLAWPLAESEAFGRSWRARWSSLVDRLTALSEHQSLEQSVPSLAVTVPGPKGRL